MTWCNQATTAFRNCMIINNNPYLCETVLYQIPLRLDEKNNCTFESITGIPNPLRTASWYDKPLDVLPWVVVSLVVGFVAGKMLR